MDGVDLGAKPSRTTVEKCLGKSMQRDDSLLIDMSARQNHPFYGNKRSDMKGFLAFSCVKR
jgi:hypothetical protein